MYIAHLYSDISAEFVNMRHVNVKPMKSVSKNICTVLELAERYQ